MPYSPPIQTLVTQLVLAKETTWGTLAPGTDSVPVIQPKWKDAIPPLVGKDLRGLSSADYWLQQGVASGSYDFSCYYYPGVGGNLLMSMLGACAVSGTTVPYTKTITQAAAPPSYSIYEANGVDNRQLAGMMMTQLDLDIAAAGEFLMSAKMLGKKSATGSPPAYAAPTTLPFIPPQALVTIGGTASSQIVQAKLSVKRPVAQNKALGNTGIVSQIQGAIEVTGTFATWVADWTDLNRYLNNTQPVTSIAFTSGTNTLTLTMSSLAYEDMDPVDRSKEEVLVSFKVRGIYNTTDSGSIKAVEVGARSTPY